MWDDTGPCVSACTYRSNPDRALHLRQRHLACARGSRGRAHVGPGGREDDDELMVDRPCTVTASARSVAVSASAVCNLMVEDAHVGLRRIARRQAPPFDPGAQRVGRRHEVHDCERRLQFLGEREAPLLSPACRKVPSAITG